MKLQFPLSESIGDPDLLTGREREFAEFRKWLSRIPKRLAKSRVILARRKSGKTAFVQRIFNELWSQNGQVVPFYLDIAEKPVWYPTFAMNYYRHFASQIMSFLERDEGLIRSPLTLEEIREYGSAKSIRFFVRDVVSMKEEFEAGRNDLVWDTAYTAPARYAGVTDRRILVILDEFQNINKYVYVDEALTNHHKDLAGSFHSASESKIAPMLVTGSYVGWMLEIMHKYLQAGRLKPVRFDPYLTPEEGLQAVYKYCEILEEPVSNETAAMINRLCFSDPFFISCVVKSLIPDRDLTTAQGVVDTVHFEATDQHSELSLNWGEYIEMTLRRINDVHAKSILMHLTQNSDRDWTIREIKEALNLELSESDIHERLRIMVRADVIEEGGSDIRYRGLRDGTLNLVLRHRFEEEIKSFVPDFKKDFHEEIKTLKKDKQRLQGMLNHLTGKFAEFQLMSEFQAKKRFALSLFFEGIDDPEPLNVVDARMRYKFQRLDGKGFEIDVIARSDCGRTVLVEVKKTENKVGVQAVRDFLEKTAEYANAFSETKIMPAFFSKGGFTRQAMAFCRENGIGTAQVLRFPTFFSGRD